MRCRRQSVGSLKTKSDTRGTWRMMRGMSCSSKMATENSRSLASWARPRSHGPPRVFQDRPNIYYSVALGSGQEDGHQVVVILNRWRLI